MKRGAEEICGGERDIQELCTGNAEISDEMLDAILPCDGFDVLPPIAPPLLLQLPAFLQTVVAAGVEEGLPLQQLQQLQLDHACYCTTSGAEYQQICAQLQGVGQRLVEGMVGGRPISTFKLHQPVLFQHWQVACIEVPCPKAGSQHCAGWEHVEFVVAGAGVCCNTAASNGGMHRCRE